ncbi:hypothetical protein EDC01DRAFT_656374 [Geopyxis carbonaria]|nr:hypothetical protein EDC01DRAFT_656374 [Geopyxis carbonaria]
MARYKSHEVEYIDGEYDPMRRSPRDYENLDSRQNDYSIASYAPHAHTSRGANLDLRYEDHTSNRGALIRPTPTVVEEPVIEHEHHHLHHHIDHGDVNGRLAMARVGVGSQVGSVARPGLGREYSYDDLDVRERRYPNGTTVSTIHHGNEHRHRHRHRHRSSRRRNGSLGRQGYTSSDIDLSMRRERGGYEMDNDVDDVTVIDVPPGSRRVYVQLDKTTRRVEAQEPREREQQPDWRREHGVRRSRGLGNELWTEITKDLVTREAIEDCGYAFEETEFFYYIFEYLDRDQIAELRELTEDIRHERVRDIEYQSIAGSTPRLLNRGGIEPGLGRGVGRGAVDDFEDTRTEIIIESSGRKGGSASGGRRRYYY